jgi:hypothetical protein
MQQDYKLEDDDAEVDVTDYHADVRAWVSCFFVGLVGYTLLYGLAGVRSRLAMVVSIVLGYTVKHFVYRRNWRLRSLWFLLLMVIGALISYQLLGIIPFTK